MSEKLKGFDPMPFLDAEFGVASRGQLAGLSGLEQMRALLNAELPAPTMARAMNIFVARAEHGEIEFRGNPGADYLNPMGLVHGGWAMTLLDSVLGCAVHTVLEPSESYVSLTTEVKFVRPILPSSGQVRAIGVVDDRTRSAATSTGKVEDQNGRLLASGTSTCLIRSAPPRPSADP